LNYILKEDHGKRIVVIENEFGEGVGVETQLAKSGVDGRDLSGFFELSNGCICCSVKDDLVVTLETLVTDLENRFDYILLEASGMAHPGPIIETFWLDEELESCLFIDGVVAMVDVVNVWRYFEGGVESDKKNQAERQLAFADRILMNKVDLLEETERDEIISRLSTITSTINPLSQIISTEYSRVPLEFVLDIRAFERSIHFGESLKEEALQHPPNHNHTEEHTHDSTPHSHLYESKCVIFDGNLDLEKVEGMLGEVLWTNLYDSKSNHDNLTASETDSETPPTIIARIKGIIWINQIPHTVQAVHELWEVTEFEDFEDEDWEMGNNRIVIIGQSLPSQHHLNHLWEETILQKIGNRK